MKHLGFALPEDAELLDVGVDWVTASWAGEASERAPSFGELRGLYDLWVLRGEVGELERDQGQGGFVGRRYGSAWLGERRGDVLVRVSSWPARLFVGWLAGMRPKVTRIDLQATIRVGGSADEVVRRAAVSSVRGRADAVGRPWRVAHIHGFGDGDTAQLGGRSSELYCRVYNKGAESPDEPEYTNTVRFEAECKGDLALHVWRELTDGEADGDAERDLLHALFTRRGVPDLGRFNEGRLPLWELPKMRTDTERQLDWLERNVSGTVQKLIHEGWREFVYNALGLE